MQFLKRHCKIEEKNVELVRARLDPTLPNLSLWTELQKCRAIEGLQ